ncbi:MAG: agmatine deiminase family protein [Cyanobacteria bacterium P01_F01_bin.116]
MKRRALVQFTATSVGSVLINQIFAGCDRLNNTETMATDFNWRMPDESAPHERTWMAFGASRKIWGHRLLPEVQDNLATIAKSIAEYEPVYMLVREADYDLAVQTCGSSVNLVICPLDDLWMRDTGPVFVKSDPGKIEGIDFNFNGWGQKQTHGHDAKVARFVAEQVGNQAIATPLVLEGGAIEVDGHGTAMMTESSVLNQNRNPGMSKSEFEALLKPLLGLSKIIWLPGIRGRDITDGHIDFYARFVRPGVVVAAYEPDSAFFDHAVTKTNLDLLRSETDADGRPLEIIVLENPQTIRPTFETDEFAAGYINFYVVNGAVIIPEFGDDLTDGKAKSILQDLYPRRDIVQLNIDAIAAGGGGIHCTTQQQPQA